MSIITHIPLDVSHINIEDDTTAINNDPHGDTHTPA